MKKIKRIITILTLIIAFTVTTNVYAASGSLSTSTDSVYVGDSFTVSVNLVSVAAWNVHVTPSGPVSGCSINQADATADAMDTNRTISATCIATGEGTITLTLSGDVTSASDGQAVEISGSKSVTAIKKQEPTPQTPTNNTTPASNNPSTPQATTEKKPEEVKKSNNNKLKEIVVEGYELVKVDDNNFTLSVKNDVEKIVINAVAEDTKSTILGTGEHQLEVGENKIELIIQAEDGSQNKINIVVKKAEEVKKEIPKEIKKDNTKEKENTTKDTKKVDYILILSIILNILLIILLISLIIKLIKNKKNESNY